MSHTAEQIRAMPAGPELDRIAGPRGGSFLVFCSVCGKEHKFYKAYLNRAARHSCSRACSKIASRSKDGIEHGGRWFVLRNGYYTDGKRRLHRVIWESANGKIPRGFVVHHKDENKTNNELSNLEIIEWGRHTHLHHCGHKTGPNGTKRLGKCIATGCERNAKAREFCTMHYQREMAKINGGWPRWVKQPPHAAILAKMGEK